MSKTSIVLQCAALAVAAVAAAMPAGANAPTKTAATHAQTLVTRAAATPVPKPTVKPFPTCGPPVNVIDKLNAMNPLVVHCPV